MLDSYTDILASVLGRADEPTDGTSDWLADAENGLIEKWRELWARYAWLCLAKHPPGAILTAAKITGLTLTATAGSTAATLSATVAVDLDGYIVLPAGKDYFIRIAAHTAGSAAVTLDAVPEDLAAAPVVIAKHEYDLPSDCGILHDTIKSRSGKILVVPEERLERECGLRPSESWPARYAARIGKRKVRFSSYPPARERLEVPYNYEPADPAGSGTVVLDAHLRPVWANGALSILYELKGDTRLATAEQRYEKGLRGAIDYEHLLRTGFGTEAARRPRPTYRGA